MKRRQLFEFGDQSWVCGWLREAYLQGLNLATRLGGHYNRAPAVFRAWAARAGVAEVLDLGSGGGGPVEHLLAAAARRGEALPRLILSDLHPRPALFRHVQARHGAARIGFIETPVAAAAVPAGAPRARSLIAALHHFPPGDARSAIAAALRDGDALFVLEPFQRDTRHLLFVLLCGPWPYLPAAFVGGPPGANRLAVAAMMPLAALMLWWDGCVSVLRTYRSAEIRALAPADAADRFEFDVGALPYGPGLRAAYFTAVRRNPLRAGRECGMVSQLR